MAELFDIEEFKNQRIYEKYSIKPSDEYEPDTAYQEYVAKEGKAPEVAFQEQPIGRSFHEELNKLPLSALANFFRGMGEAEVGIAGDVEQLYKYAKAYFADPQNEEEYNALISALEEPTTFPTTEDVAKKTGEYIGERPSEFYGAQKTGEILAPGVLVAKLLGLLRTALKPKISKAGIAATATAPATKVDAEGKTNDNTK